MSCVGTLLTDVIRDEYGFVSNAFSYYEVYYVNSNDPNASDSNTGKSRQLPFKTLQHAANVALINGGTIRLLDKIPDTDSLIINNNDTSRALIIYGDIPSFLRASLLCTVNISGSERTDLYFYNLNIDQTALSVGDPSFSIIQDPAKTSNLLFFNCELSKLDITGTDTIISGHKIVRFRDSVIRSLSLVPTGDIVFKNLEFLRFHDCIIDPFSQSSINNTRFVRDISGNMRILFTSSGEPEKGYASSNEPPLSWRHFAQKNPSIEPSNGANIQFGLNSDVYFSANDVLPLPSGTTMDCLGSDINTDININSGAELKLINSVAQYIIGDGQLLLENSKSKAKIKTASHVLKSTDQGVIKYDATLANIIITAQPLANYNDGDTFELRRMDGSANTITFQPDGTETIVGLPSVNISQYENLIVQVNNGAFKFWGVL